MIRAEELSDRELATCVDTFVQRAVDHARKLGYLEAINVQIVATQYTPDSEYTIEHMATCGQWNRENKSITNNLVGSVDNIIARWLADNLDAPTTVRPMITHQPETQEELEHVEEVAEYAEVSPISGEDDMPL